MNTQFFNFDMELLTKYINRVLKKDVRVKDWGFGIDMDFQHGLIVTIDYLNDFHSRDIIPIYLNRYDLEEMKAMFNITLQKHFEELNTIVAKADKIF